MAPRHGSMHLVDPQLWGSAMRCQSRGVKDFFSTLLGGSHGKLSTIWNVAEQSRPYRPPLFRTEENHFVSRTTTWTNESRYSTTTVRREYRLIIFSNQTNRGPGRAANFGCSRLSRRLWWSNDQLAESRLQPE